jgi:hypothetical protein
LTVCTTSKRISVDSAGYAKNSLKMKLYRWLFLIQLIRKGFHGHSAHLNELIGIAGQSVE